MRRSPSRIVAYFGRKPARPERDTARHRLLHVRIARQRDRALALRQAVERLGDALGASRQVRHDVAQIEAQRREHLVVARPARVQTAAGRAQLLREPGLERGLAILELEGDPPLAARMRRTDLAQRVAYCSAVRGGQNSAGVQRLGVRDRGFDVIGHEPIVERMVFARGELEHPAVERRALVPEPRHAPPVPCSAGDSAFVSATTSVPVPSLVKISASSASGAE